MINIDLSNQSAVITGASQGLGKEIALRFHAAGANVVINYFDDPNGDNKAKAEAIVAQLGERASMFAADVRNNDQAAALMQHAVETFGGLDILVNNAGILRDRSVKKMSVSEWQDVIDTNLTGVFNTSQTGAAVMNEGGRIISMSSAAAVMGIFGQANYAAAKAGVIALTKVLCRELSRRNIRVNAVAPGVALTEMGHAIPEENRKIMLGQIPLARFADPVEVANVVLFLASDLSSYMTGQTLHVNGGWWI
jgi:3-oxoacyl-[acyl-carrier protein] reductase